MRFGSGGWGATAAQKKGIDPKTKVTEWWLELPSDCGTWKDGGAEKVDDSWLLPVVPGKEYFVV